MNQTQKNTYIYWINKISGAELSEGEENFLWDCRSKVLRDVELNDSAKNRLERMFKTKTQEGVNGNLPKNS